MSEPADVSMTPEARDALNMLQQLSTQLLIRTGDVQRWQDYYEGRQGLQFATDEYRKYFGDLYRGFRDNWCAPVVDTLAEKLTVAGLLLANPSEGNDDDGGYDVRRTADRDFARVWEMNEGEAQSSQAFVEGAIARRSFALVWGNDDDPDTPEITFESPDEVIVGYEPGARRHRKAALKQWTDGSYDYATLYTPTTIWKWQRKINRETKLWTPDINMRAFWVPRWQAGDDIWPIPNPAGEVPMVELPNRPRLRADPLSEVEGVAAMQDAINALWAYLFTTADFAALPQRVVLGAALPKLPVLDKNGQPTGTYKPIDPETWMKAAASRRMLAFEGDNAKIAQYDAADLKAFTDVIEFAVGHVAAQSRTPVHYFVTGKIANVSAEGLEALGQAHIAKVQERAVYLGAGIRELACMQYLMRGDKARAMAARRGRVVWRDFETKSMAQLADYALKMRQAEFSRMFVAGKVISDPVALADEIERQETEAAQNAAQTEFGPKPDAGSGGSDVPSNGPYGDHTY